MHDELADIQGLKQKLAELDFEKEVLEARLQALTDSVGDPLVESAPSIDRVRGCLSVDVESGVFLGHRPQSPADQIDIYRQAVAALTSVLPLRRSGPVGDNDNTRTSAFSLADFFVDLETDLRGTESAKIVAPDAERQGGHSLFSPSVEYGEETAEDEGAPHQLSALEAAIRRRSQVLLGAPGSGKTTFLSFLANALALGDSEHLHGWPADERNHLPIFVILRDYDAWLGARGTTREANASLLWEFVLCDLRARNLDFVTISLSDALGRGEILLLLDGLDQVSFNLMPLVRDSIQDFRKQYVGCRILVTCRALAYEAPSMQLPGEFFPKTTLLPFDSRRVDRFIGNWFEQAVTDGQTTPSKAREKAKALRELVHRRNLRQRASNPMHLSVMALVYASRGELPDTRAGIYEEAIGTLLWHGDRDSRTGESGLKLSLREAGRSPNDLIGLLEQLSFEVCADGQATSGIADEERGLIAGIGEQDLISALCRLHPQKRLEWAQAVADTLKLRTGLFLERQPGALSYFHRSFHEYLAGARLAHHLDFPERAAALVEEGSVWDEVILFAVGFLVHNQREVERPLSLAHRLCPSQVPSDDLGWRKVWMSGEVLLEIGLSRVCDNKRRAGFLKLVRSRLAAIVERGMLRTRERARVGDVLGLLGDGRFHARRFHQPALFRGRRENALGLVAIAPGPFVMGSRESDRDRRSSEIGNP
ncbi:MAG: NACHT domain-containing protein, partial [Chromatiaceae bacterium]|nr:NACHT domain-containing protein [Chromatiaceae bacterium]